MAKLYEKCPYCNGRARSKTVSCLGCRGEGYLEIGLTTGQVERLVEAERVRLGDPAVRDRPTPTKPRRNRIEIDGESYNVTDDLGFQAGFYTKEVEVKEGERRMVVRPDRSAPWQFWSVARRLGLL